MRAAVNALPDQFKKSGFFFSGTPSCFYAVKNRFSPIATLLFHFSFFLMLLGGVITVYTRFSATVDLAEGEFFSGALEQYHGSFRMPKIGVPPDIPFAVEKITPVIEQDTAVGLSVAIRDRQGRLRTVEINKPYKEGNTSFVFKNLGVAPLFIIADRSGRELDGAYVKLNVLNGKQDVFSLAGHDFDVDFFPDHAVHDGRDLSRSQQMRNPVFGLSIKREGRFVARRTIRPGETILFDDRQLSCKELRYWVRFYVVKESGLSVLYTGFAAAAIALVWRFLFYRREIAGMLEQKREYVFSPRRGTG